MSTTCSEDDLEEIDEEPSHTEDDCDDHHQIGQHQRHDNLLNDSYDVKSDEVSYDEYDDGTSTTNNNNNYNNNNSPEIQTPESVDRDQVEEFGHSSMSVAHRINLDNCNANNNTQWQYPSPTNANAQQPDLLSPNANTVMHHHNSSMNPPHTISTNIVPITTNNPAATSTSMNSNNIVITTQPLSSFTGTTNCNNTATLPTNATDPATTNTQHQHNNPPMQDMQKIENLHSNSNSNSNLNSPQIPKTSNAFSSSPSGGKVASSAGVNVLSTVSSMPSSASSSISSSSSSNAASGTTTASNDMQTPQNQLQNQNQNISSSLEIILSPIILSSRR